MATILSKNVETKQQADSSTLSAVAFPVTSSSSIPSVPANSPWVNQKLTETLLKGKQQQQPQQQPQQQVSEETKREEPAASLERLSLKEQQTPSTEPSVPTQLYTFSRLKSHLKSSLPHSQDAFLSSVGNALTHIPDIYEFERNKPYAPAFPLASHPPFYPANPPSLFEHAPIYEKFDTDTLFFIFYFLPRTLQQYLAARQLKRQSWRFHKKYLTWFQRFEEPKIVNDDWEQGTYIYFDWEGSWCQRKKTEFTFEYRFLEDVELP